MKSLKVTNKPMMKLRELTNYLESLAPLDYQEAYDNAGLLVGRPDKEVRQALLSLDCTEAVVEEAIELGCDVVISHHPIVFKGLKRFNGSTYRSEEHTSELQSLMRISYAVFCLKKKKKEQIQKSTHNKYNRTQM